MIPITYIKRNSQLLDKQHRKSSQQLLTLMFAKMSIVEVAGWVEMSMDDLVERSGKKLKVKKNIDYLDDVIVEKTWGFDYERNFRTMLMRTIGLIQLEKLESSLDNAKHVRMIAAIKLLKKARNSVAHTYIKDHVTTRIDAPSQTLAHFNEIYEGLMDIEAKMKTLKLI